MKHVMLLFSAALAASLLVADTGKPSVRKGRRPPRGSQVTGGLVEKAYTGNVFRVAIAKCGLDGVDLPKLNREIRYATTMPIECVQDFDLKGMCPIEAADALAATEGVGAGALIVEDEKLPIFLFSPDHRWGILNLTSIRADNPGSEVFARRVAKLYWMLVARTLGAGYSSYPGCVLVPFSNMKELDAIIATKPCPEPFNKMFETGRSYGINMLTIRSYRTACQEGWAPTPTNDVQKAIWDKVHAMPQNPMKIEFDSKKGR